jgi:hypothetical protein
VGVKNEDGTSITRSKTSETKITVTVQPFDPENFEDEDD